MPSEMNSWSYSRISTWLLCPRKFLHRYIAESSDESTSSALAFGSALHESLAYMYRGILEHDPHPDDDVLDSFKDFIDDEIEQAELLKAPVAFKDGETTSSMVEKGRAMLKVYLEQMDRHVTVLGVEQEFDVLLTEGKVLYGIFDLVTANGEGIIITDFKSSATAYSQDKLDHDLQSTTYLFAARKMMAAPIRFQFQVLTKTKTPTVKTYPVTRTGKDEQELLELIAEIDRAVEYGVYPRSRGWQCHGCEYQRQCQRSAGPSSRSTLVA